MRSLTLTRVLVLVISGLQTIWAEYHHSHHQEDYYYGAYDHSLSHPKRRFIRSEPVTSVPLDEKFEDIFSENHSQLFPDRLLTIEELMDGGSGDRFPPDLHFIDDTDIMNLHDSTTGSPLISTPTTELPNLNYAHLWPIHDEQAHVAVPEEMDIVPTTSEEIINRNLRDSTKAANKRQISPGTDFKPVFLLPSQIQQHLAIVIPGQPGQMSFLVPLDKTFAELLSRSVIIPGQGILLQELQGTRPAQPIDGIFEEAFLENSFQADQPFPVDGQDFVDVNGIPVDDRVTFDSSLEHFQSDQGAIEKNKFSESQPLEEIHFVPFDSKRLTTPSPTRSPLHDQLLHAKVVVAPESKIRNGKNRPIITAIPSVVASSPRHQEQAQRTAPDISASNQSDMYNDFTTEDSSGAYENDLLEQERTIRHLLAEDQELINAFLRSVDSNEVPDYETFTQLPKEQVPEVRQTSDHSQERRSVVNVAEPRHTNQRQPAKKRPTRDQLTRIQLLPVRLVRQDSPIESQIAAQLDDGHRETRMPRPKSPTTWPKPGQAAATFSGKPPSIRPSGQSSSRASIPSRPRQSTLMMALLPRHLLHPVPSAAPPQQVPPGRPQPIVHAQQAQSDEILAAAQSQAQQERPERPVPRQSQRQEADPTVPKTIARQQENGQNNGRTGSQGKKESPGVQDAKSVLSHQSGTPDKVTETSQGSQGNQGSQTTVMQSTSPFTSSSLDQIPTVMINKRPPPPNRVPPAGFHRPPHDLASPSGSVPSNADSSTRSKRSASFATIAAVPLRVERHWVNNPFRWH